LFAIKGLLQLAEAQPESSAAHLAAARVQVETLEQLVAGWSDLSRRPGAVTTVFDLRSPVESALVLLRQRGAASGVRVVGELGDALAVRSSELGVQQAVVNLGQNALDALAGRPDAELHVRLEAASVVVEDNGPGLPAPVRDQLFVPFTTTRRAGTGLGLPLAKALVEGAGGELRLEEAVCGVRWRIVLAPAA
jgi:two-component system C4-dicarboxylate transport sensor histidine kinase DctB